jgi:hypothetical protein
MDTSHAENVADSGQLLPMEAPPPVSSGSYATTFTSETESNYLHLGLTVTVAYSNNIAGYSGNATGRQATTAGGGFSFWPTIAFDKSTERSHCTLNYSPGFTLYQPAGVPIQANQSVFFALQYRLSPNVTANVGESFNRTSNIFNQPNPLSAISISGAAPPPPQAVIPVTGDQRMNGTNAQITYHCGENCMIGASGAYNSLRFSSHAQVASLYNSSSGTGSTFYSRRLGGKYYLGASYQFQEVSSYQPGSPATPGVHARTQLLLGFFTVYLKPALSVSFSGGPQHFTSAQATLPATSSWSPMTMVSLGWQGGRTSLSASYSRIISGAGGLNGLFESNMAGISARWQMSRAWTMGLTASYLAYQDLIPALSPSSTRGHTSLGTASVERLLGKHISLQAGYNLIQQSYHGTVSAIPTTSRVFISVAYKFERPL